MTPLRRSVLSAALCAGLAIPAAAGAQAWSVGRPDPQPELAAPRPPSYPAAPRRGAPAPAAAQTVTVSPDGAPLDASVTLRPATGQPEGDSTLVEELEIVIRAPGPAMWRVTRGGSEVVILGGYSPCRTPCSGTSGGWRPTSTGPAPCSCRPSRRSACWREPG